MQGTVAIEAAIELSLHRRHYRRFFHRRLKILRRTTNARSYRASQYPGYCTPFCLKPCSYRPSQLYDVVSDVTSYPKFIPYCTNTRIVSRPVGTHDDASVTKMDAEMTVRFMAFEASYISNVTCKRNEYVEVSISFFSSLHDTHSSVRP